MTDEMGWVALEQRRKRNRLYNPIINGYTLGTELPAIYLPQMMIINRCHHSSRFILPAANTTSYQVSFFYHTVKDCNDLSLNFYS